MSSREELVERMARAYYEDQTMMPSKNELRFFARSLDALLSDPSLLLRVLADQPCGECQGEGRFGKSHPCPVCDGSGKLGLEGVLAAMGMEQVAARSEDNGFIVFPDNWDLGQPVYARVEAPTTPEPRVSTEEQRGSR